MTRKDAKAARLADSSVPSANDAKETAELLRASHTLLRMAFGACSLVKDLYPSEDAAMEFVEHFNFAFNQLRKGYDYYVGVFKKLSKSESSNGSDK